MSFDISNVVPRNEYVASGSADFTVSFEYETKADVVVLLDSVTQLLDVDYTLTDPMLTGGGTCTFVIVPTNGQKVVIYRNQVTSRVTAYTTHGNLPGLTLDLDVDRLTMLVQELRRDRDRTVRIPNEDVTGATTLLPIAATRANRFLHCDSLGNIDTAELLATGTVLSGAIISSYLTPAIVGLGLWPRTADEISAGVTPTLYRYPPLDARRYGADPAASAATNATAINNAGLVAFTGGGGEVLLPAGTLSYNTAIICRNSVRFKGTERGATTLSYTGAAEGFKSVSPGTRIYECSLRDFSMIDAGTGTIGIDWDSVSNGEITNVSVDGFTTDVRLYAPTAGYAVYNRLYNVKAFNATTGFLINGLGSNAHTLMACRGSTCTFGVDIVDSNENHIFASQFESGTNGVRVTTSAALSASNYVTECRFENNSGTNIIIATSSCSDTRLLRNYHPGGVQYSDSGTRTQIDDLYPNAAGSPMSVQQTGRVSTDGCWKRIRTASATGIPVYVIGDSNTGSGTPDQLHIVNKRGVGTFLSLRDDFYPAGNELGFIDADGTFGGRFLFTVSADRGDTSQTLTVGTDEPRQRWATNLTANRTVTLSTTGAKNGDAFRVVRTGLGAFNLDVGGLKTIVGALAAFVDVGFDGTAWRLTGYGTL